MLPQLKWGLIGGIILFVLVLFLLQAPSFFVNNSFSCSTAGGDKECRNFSEFMLLNFLPLPFTIGMFAWIGFFIGLFIGTIIGGRIEKRKLNLYNRT